MDKNTKRKILYKKAPETAPVVPKKESKKKEKAPTVPVSDRSDAQKIADWINGHKYFKWSSMCRESGIDFGNFHRVLKASPPVMKQELIDKILPVLKDYGYAE